MVCGVCCVVFVVCCVVCGVCCVCVLCVVVCVCVVCRAQSPTSCPVLAFSQGNVYTHSEKQATNWTLCIPWMESGSDMTCSITERTPSAYMSVILSASHCRSCDNHVIRCMVT